jgi:hypothetical protein
LLAEIPTPRFDRVSLSFARETRWWNVSSSDAYRIRYTRRRDRILAVIWPPKRRMLRLQQTLLTAGIDTIRGNYPFEGEAAS